MNISLTLSPDDNNDIDADDETGITNDAYERLVAAVSGAGFSIVDGPEAS